MASFVAATSAGAGEESPSKEAHDCWSQIVRIPDHQFRGRASGHEISKAQAMRSCKLAPDLEGVVSLAVLEVQGTAVDVDTPLMSAGLDSIAATEFVNVLVERLSIELP